jgi:SAM-dependent methyltransferase
MNKQGVNAEKLFHGKGESIASKLFYNESADLFAEAIRKCLKPGKYTLTDLGGHRGEFLSEIIAKVPEYQFDSIIIDSDTGACQEFKKIIADISNTGIVDESIDVVIVRYVLAWNSLEKQRQILNEIKRICRGICIIQHQGTEENNSLLFQKDFGYVIPKMRRSDGVFTDPKQLELWMKEFEINFEKIQDRRIDGLSEIAIEKYALDDKESFKIRKLLDGRDYIIQTSWILKFYNLSK